MSLFVDMARPQKQCIFCDNPAGSKEHFWPGWMHELLPQLTDPKHDRKFITGNPTEGYTEGGVSGRQGGLETIKIRVLCNPCNTVWGRRLEEDVRPLLTPIIKRSPVALDFEQMALIARWVALKCMVAEHANAGVWVTPRDARIAFRQHGTIPDFFRIYIANHNMKDAAGFVRHSFCMLRNSGFADPPLAGAPNNIQTITFTLGSVFVHLNAARIKNYTIEGAHLIEPFYSHSRVWPFQHHEMIWPRRPLIDRNGMSLIANTLETIKEAALVRWVDRPK